MDPNALISALYPEDDNSDSVALAAALRGQEQMGLLGLVSGDKVLGGVGNALLSGAARGNAQLEARKHSALQKALAVAEAKRQAMFANQKREQELTDKTTADTEWDRRNGVTSGQLMERTKVMARAQGGKEEAAAQERVHNRAEELRKELQNSPITKSFQNVETSYSKIRGAAAKPSAAGDMAVVFSFMKMMDEGSSVREGEYANATNAAGVPERVRNVWNNLVNGQLLNPSQRADFLNRAKGFRDTHANQYKGLLGKYRAYAPRVGVSPEDVTFGLDFEDPSAPGPGKPTGGNFNLDDGGGTGMYTADDEARYQQLVKKRKALE